MTNGGRSPWLMGSQHQREESADILRSWWSNKGCVSLEQSTVVGEGDTLMSSLEVFTLLELLDRLMRTSGRPTSHKQANHHYRIIVYRFSSFKCKDRATGFNPLTARDCFSCSIELRNSTSWHYWWLVFSQVFLICLRLGGYYLLKAIFYAIEAIGKPYWYFLFLQN